MATTTAPVPKPVPRTPRPLRVILTVVVAVYAVFAVASAALALVDVAARHEFTTRASIPGVRSIIVDNSLGDVHFVRAPSGAPVSVRTHITEGLRTPHMSVKRGPGGVLNLSASCSNSLVGASCDVGFTVAVPPGVHLRKVSSSGGDIDARGLVTPDPLKFSSSGGDVSVDGVRAPGLELHSSGGDVTATGVRSPVIRAESSGGDVHVEISAPPRSVSADSSGGDVHLVVPDLVYALKASSSGGDVSDHDVRQDPHSPRKIDASSSGGDVQISVRR
jgi:Toastrack DUF4097